MLLRSAESALRIKCKEVFPVSDYILTCESTADLTPGHFRARDIPYVMFHFALDGKEYMDDLGESLPFEQFYGRIAAGADTRTAQVNVSQYRDLWRPFLEEGKDIVHVTFSSGLSGTINSARNAAAILEEEYPDRRIRIVDSLGASSGYGMLMDEAADRRDSGISAEELVNWMEENKLRLHHWFFSTDLSTYVRGGRISKTAAVFGGILEICPLLNMDNTGHLMPREKIRTKKRVIKEIVKRMEQHAQGGLGYSGKCYISQSNCMEDARAVADLIEAEFKNLNGKVEINWVGTTVGAHTGPGTVALYFWGDERTV